MRHRRKPTGFAVVAVALSCALVASTAAASASDGGGGLGDPYFPEDGNSGYDVQHYAVNVTFDPAKPDLLIGDTTVTAVATDDLSRFHLDLVGFTVEDVAVDGTPAKAVARSGAHELVITPAQRVPRGAPFLVRVRYSGQPTGPGWRKLTGGGAYASGDPIHSATSWYPANDHPSDKATFQVAATVPEGWAVIGNGLPGPETSADGMRTFRWHQDEPMSTYLSTIAIDKFTVHTSTLADGTPVFVAYGTGTTPSPDEALYPEIMAFLSEKFGDYPYSSAGAIVVSPEEGGGPLALETQSRPTYQGTFFDASMVHENAHQWFGDSVTIADWRDGCVDECFAQYANQLWDEHQGADLDQDFYRTTVEENRNNPEFWGTKLYDPGPGKELDPALYFKGSLMLHALRRTVGDDAFFSTLRQWQRDRQYGNGSWLDFETLIQQVSTQDLSAFFTAWVHSEQIPPDQYLYPTPLR
ncbi:M1 family metallopeptidase [Saccharopolyspora sp. 5N708]|uniref:M1 family metallopeptidase n=1 Tax=Saccharopolyspora sp. 5N708 TaxID=3457424 RepID=UPI003FD279A7